MNDPHVLAIIPAYNEELHIGTVVKKMTARGVDVLVVDDHSSDHTAVVAKNAGAKVISLPINLRYSGALQVGYNYAVQYGYRYIIQLDGDGQHDPDYCEKLLAPVIQGEADIAYGSRFLCDECYAVPKLRRLGQIFFAKLVSCKIGETISDPTTGYQAMNNNVAQLFCTDIFPDDYPDADLRIILNRLKFKVKEVPVRMYSSETESMHDGIHRQIYYVYKMSLAILIAPFKKLSNYKRH